MPIEYVNIGLPIIISDEIYHGLVYGEKANSILEFTDRAFVLNGFSYAHSPENIKEGPNRMEKYLARLKPVYPIRHPFTR